MAFDFHLSVVLKKHSRWLYLFCLLGTLCLGFHCFSHFISFFVLLLNFLQCFFEFL